MSQITHAHLLAASIVVIAVMYYAFSRWQMKASLTLITMIYLGSFAAQFGAQLWVTFVAGAVMLKQLSRRSFGQVQSHLFPWFFSLGSLMSVTTFVTFIMKRPAKTRFENFSAQTFLLGGCMLLWLLNYFILSPKTINALLKRNEIEAVVGIGDKIGTVDTSKLKQENEKYRKLHREFFIFHVMSTLVNMVVVLINFVHLYLLVSNGL